MPPVLLPWSALGWPADLPTPTRFGVALCSTADLRWFTGGLVLEPETVEFEDDDQSEYRIPTTPIEDGLFDEVSFGPIERDASGELVLREAFDQHPYDRVQSRSYGLIPLCEPVVSPWLERFGALFDPRPDPVRLAGIPVIPPAHRPMFLRDRRTYTADLNSLYRRVINRTRRLARLKELNAPEIIIDNERMFLQQTVNCLMVDGLTIFDDPEEPGETEDELDPEEARARIEEGEKPVARLASLRDQLVRDNGWQVARWIDDTLAREPKLLSVIRWPAGCYAWRAYLMAAGLELVPMFNGKIDEDAREHARINRFVHLSGEVHDRELGEGLRVFHRKEDLPGCPHIDVCEQRPEPDGPYVLISSGMCLKPMPEHGTTVEEPFIELACMVPGLTDEATRDALMHTLWMVANLPWRRGTHLAERHQVELDQPIAPGSELCGFVLVACETEWADHLTRALPMRPRILLAVGLNAHELAHGNERSRDDLIEAARSRLHGMTDVSRTGSVL